MDGCPLSWAGGRGGQEGVAQAPDEMLDEAGGVGQGQCASPLSAAHQAGPPSPVTPPGRLAWALAVNAPAWPHTQQAWRGCS